ncbi:MAG: hypothetical protein ACRDOK_25620, partial [Streptosporangiaceae bacterium]
MTEPIREAATSPVSRPPAPGRCHRSPGATAPDEARAGGRAFASLLAPAESVLDGLQDQPDPAIVSDLNLDQIVDAAAGDREERDLITALLYRQVRDPATIGYRHEVFRDLEDTDLFQAAVRFAEQMRQVRVHLDQQATMHSARQREGWFLDAAAIYCDAVRSLASDLNERPVTSRGLTEFRA